VTAPVTSLPVDPTAHLDDQRHQALTYADGQGWLAFEHVTPGPRATRRYVIEVNGRPRLLPADAVLPYVTALADAHGVGHLFPDREDTPR
jgi:hypothetical protein